MKKYIFTKTLIIYTKTNLSQLNNKLYRVYFIQFLQPSKLTTYIKYSTIIYISKKNQMEKKKLNKLMKYWKYLKNNPDENQINSAIDIFPTSEEVSISYDRVNTLVWWILTIEQKEHIRDYFNWKLEEKNIESKEIKKLIIDITRFIVNTLDNNSLNRVNTEEYIGNLIQENKWVALEYFIMDILLRNWVNIKQWSHLLDHNKIDFLSKTNWIKLWNQLTFIDRKNISKKENDMAIIRDEIDNPNEEKWYKLIWQKWTKFKKYNLNTENFWINNLPDIPVLFIINSKVSTELSKRNICSIAYKKWKEEGYDERWPSQYLKKSHKEQINLIWETYQEASNIFYDFINNSKNNLNLADINFTIPKQWYIYHIDYSWLSNTLKISLFNNKDKTKKQEFIYSLKFYITNKLLEKIWRDKELKIRYKKKDNNNNNKENKKKKSIQTNSRTKNKRYKKTKRQARNHHKN